MSAGAGTTSSWCGHHKKVAVSLRPWSTRPEGQCWDFLLFFLYLIDRFHLFSTVLGLQNN